MPPKKKSGKGGKKEKKGEKSKSARPTRQGGEQLGETSKAFYLLQIRDLENRLARYQIKLIDIYIHRNRNIDLYFLIMLHKVF